MMIPQSKGKDLDKVPKSKLLLDGYYLSIKYDGNYVQIHKKGDTVKFYTSGGKPFYIANIAEELIELNPGVDFILEAEYINESSGKLGQRRKAAKLTTYRTMFGKAKSLASEDEKFMVFDVIKIGTFAERLDTLVNIKGGRHCETAVQYGPYSLEECKDSAKGFIKRGFEGVYLKHKDHEYYAGKRVNNAIKLKMRPTVDLLCTGVIAGEGKYTGMIGSLELTDSFGRVVCVGSGLSDLDRSGSVTNYLDKVIEIEYEQIMDTYIQPTFVRVREDKIIAEID